MRIIGHAKGQIIIAGLRLEIPSRTWHNSDIAEMAHAAELLHAMMTLTYLPAAVADDMLANITATGLYMGLNTASPGSTGANEIVPGTGYTGNRPAIAWATSANGVVSSNDTQSYTLSSAQTGGIPYFSLWTASTAGTYLGGGTTSGLSGSIPSGAVVSFASSVTLTVSG